MTGASARAVSWKAIATIALLMAGSRGVLLLLAGIVPGQFALPLDSGMLPDLLCRWDCSWYLGVAGHGYSLQQTAEGWTNFAFFPLFPLLIRAVAPILGGNELIAAIAISNACFFGALMYVYRYALALQCEERVAMSAVALLCLLPGSLAFSAALTESLFLFLLSAAIFHLRRGDYLLAGLAAALLSATRANGVLFVVFALAYLLRNGGVRSFLAPWRKPESFIPLVFAPAGLFVFWGYCFIATGDAFAQTSTAHHGWHWEFSAPWHNIPAMLHAGGNPELAALSGLATLCAAGILVRQGLLEEFLLCAAMILLVLSGTGTVSIYRYWIVLFPIAVALARVVSQRPLAAALLYGIAGIINGVLTFAWTLAKPIAL